MGYSFIKHLDATGYNRKLFFLDTGAIDLPVISGQIDIQPGSMCQCLATGDEWALNSKFEWIQTVDGNLLHDIPNSPIGIKYVREATAGGPAWTPAQFTANVAVENFAPSTAYEKYELTMYGGGLYRAKNSFTSGTVFNPSDWEAIEAQVITKINDFVPMHDYAKNEAITRDGNLYRAKGMFTSSATFAEADWSLVVIPVGKSYTLAEWAALPVKPELAVITNSIYDI